ncbi:haloacid type II [Pyrrhoderma noxium]|uniref:Haloacid type II n=1 Tax=Pyrrhoderma noxium TaxID=2282107 RepID=A0A286UF20_9AGAM|nr:haloacid type II [Pyrrhoderma noxium]
MTSKYVQTLAFDVYGTLCDTASISSAIAKYLSIERDRANVVSSTWRIYQLEYTWRMNSMNIYEPFDIVTRNSLVHTLKELQIPFTEEAVQDILESYNKLACFPETLDALRQLQGLENVKIIIFSNGTYSMVKQALQEAGLSSLYEDIFVADSIKCYKPDPAIYNGLLSLANQGGGSASNNCWLVSGNPFDITGALSCGLKAIWVDRAHKGWSDSLLGISPSAKRPTSIVNSLEDIAQIFQGPV